MEYKKQLQIGDQGITKRTAWRHNINLNDNVRPVMGALHHQHHDHDEDYNLHALH